MDYILEYRRNSSSEPFKFAGIITVKDGKILYRFKKEYEEKAKVELEKLPPNLYEIAKAADNKRVTRTSPVYSEKELDELFEEFLKVEERVK